MYWHLVEQQSNELQVTRIGKVRVSRKSQFTSDDLEFALEQAAGFLDMEEWPGDNPEVQKAANQEAAKRIRAMVKRLVTRRIKHNATRR